MSKTWGGTMKLYSVLMVGGFLAVLSTDLWAEKAFVYSALVEQSGVIACSSDESVSCELSAVAWVKGDNHGQIIWGNDKTPKSANESGVFAMSYTGKVFQADVVKTFYFFSPFSQIGKIEAMSSTPDGRFAMVATAFDRFDENNAELDKYNTLIVWPTATPEKAKVVLPSQRQGIESSLALRNRIANAIQRKYGKQATYFKVEGLALLPGNRLLFGIREIGQNYASFDYRVVLLEGHYQVLGEEFVLDRQAELEVICDFSAVADTVGRKVGLSSIEYDALQKRLYLLTSYEDNHSGKIGAYMWVVPVADDGVLGAIELVKNADGLPFEFTHKAEGLAVLEDGRVLIVHDDDRNLTDVHIGGANGGQLRTRKSNEAAFDILRVFKKSRPQ